MKYAENLTKIIKNLKFVLSCPELANAMTNADYVEILNNQLETAKFLSLKAKAKSKEVDSLIKTFETKTGKKIKANNQKPETDLEIVDIINYLVVYTKNIYKIDITTGKAADIADMSVEESTKNITKEGLAGLFGSGSNVDPAIAANAKNLFQQGAAQMKVQEDAMQGKVYLYKDKPKIILWVKYFNIAFFSLLTIGLLSLSIIMFIVNGKIKDDDGKDVSTIFDGITYLILVLINCFLLKGMIGNFVKIKNPKMPRFVSNNDNSKYFFSWQILAFYAVLLTVMIFTDIFGFKPDIFHWLFDNDQDGLSHNIALVWCISEICFVAGTACVIGCIALGSIFNPKLDSERIKGLVQEYSATIFSQPTPTAPIVEEPIKEKSTDKSKSKSKKN